MFAQNTLKPGRPDPVLSGKIVARNLGWRERRRAGEQVKQIAARPGDGIAGPVSVKTVWRGIQDAEAYYRTLAGLVAAN